VSSSIERGSSQPRLGMATTSNARRDLYASSEPKPKSTGKKRNASPPKKNSPHKRATGHPKTDKRELTQEEISLLTYQSISMLLDAARMLDEAEKKGSPISTPSVQHPPKTAAVPVAPPTVPDPPAVATPKTVKPKVKRVRKVPATSKQTPAVVPPTAQDDLNSSSSSSAVAALFDLSSQQPPRTHAPAPVIEIEPVAPVAPAAAAVAAPVAAMEIEESMTVRAYLKPAKPVKTTTVVEPTTTAIPAFFPRGLAPLPIPADLADIAVPVAPRSVPTIPRKRQTPKKKGKTPAQIAAEMERERNFGYPDECRTRVPDALRRFMARQDQKRRETDGPIYNNYYWK
ncbi:hypothetical protein PFISCL1PPCAC_26971, partial [Pristionchus fissidentatus]